MDYWRSESFGLESGNPMYASHTAALIFFAGYSLGSIFGILSIGALLQRDADHFTASGGTDLNPPPEPDPSRSPRNVEGAP